MFSVAIIGRPNVGKSTFFNRLVKSRVSIVEDMPGVTRDRIYHKVEYLEKEFTLIDTGGITLEDGDFNAEIKMQANIAIDESDLILFLVDARSSMTEEEQVIASLIRKSKKEVIVVCNKVDNISIAENIYEYYALGFERVIPISSLHGNGVMDVLDEIIPHITDAEPEEEGVVKFALIGRPNVGKSSLFNAIIDDERSIVSNIEGTTRDAIDYRFDVEDKKYKIVDTAGIRRRGKVYEKVEKYSVLRSLRAVEEADIILWLIDAEEGLIEQDKRVLGYALDQYKPVVIVVNKWDLVNKETNTQRDYELELKAKMPFIKDSRMIFLSALTKKGTPNILPIVDELYGMYTMEFPTNRVNTVLGEAVSSKVHPTHKGKNIRFYYATQVASKPPKFLIFVNDKDIIHFSYKRYLENYFKKSFDLKGIKLQFSFRNKVED